jgi:hypothetical protein
MTFCLEVFVVGFHDVGYVATMISCQKILMLPQPCSPFLFCHILSSATASGTSEWHSGW